MSRLIRTFLIGIAPIALLGLGAEVRAQANDVNCFQCIDTKDIAPKSVTSGKIAPNAINTSKLKKGAVTKGKIAARAVTSGKIKIGAVGLAQIDTSEVAMQRHVMLCGSSSRDVTTFVPGYPAIDVIAGCTPTRTTIAMLVSRSGVGQLDQSELQNFISGGGSVICEFFGCDDVFNLVFNEAVAEGEFLGDCSDKAQPEVQLSPSDNVWKGVDHVPPPADKSGCGQNMQAFPGITAIGGWTEAGSVSHAYRDLGDGRLWLVEQDWQDNETSPDYRHSRRLLGYMLTHVR